MGLVYWINTNLIMVMKQYWCVSHRWKAKCWQPNLPEITGISRGWEYLRLTKFATSTLHSFFKQQPPWVCAVSRCHGWLPKVVQDRHLLFKLQNRYPEDIWLETFWISHNQAKHMDHTDYSSIQNIELQYCTFVLDITMRRVIIFVNIWQE